MSGIGPERDPELEDMARRFWVSALLTLPVVGIAMLEMLHASPLTTRLAPDVRAWVQLALGTPVVLWGGWPFFVRGWASIRTRRLNMFTLIAIGTGAAAGHPRRRSGRARTAPAPRRRSRGHGAISLPDAAVCE